MPVIATCPVCRRSWTGTNQAHCTSCHEHFSTVKNFDAHHPGPRRSNGQPGCGKPAELTRTRRDGTVTPVLKSVDLVDGPLWVSWSDDTRFDGDDE